MSSPAPGVEGCERYTRVTSATSPGFLERLGATACGAAAGAALVLLSFYLLFTNEGRAIRTSSSLAEGLSGVVTLHPDSYADPRGDGRLVHLAAELHTSQPLYDPNYKVAVHAVKLRRNVEMYQWVEHQETRDYEEDGETKSETTYTYNTEWKSEVVNSRNFDEEIGHANPSAMAVESVTVVAPDVRVGRFFLSKGLIDQIDSFQVLSLGGLPLTDPFITVYQDHFYHTAHPHRPEVGDVRVSFSYAGLSGQGFYPGPAQKVSVVAMQRGDQLMPFKTKSGDTLEILYQEDLTAEEVFAREQKVNVMKTWALRAAGWLLMYVGINLTMRIFYTLVDWLPVLRELVSVGVRLFAVCVSCSLSLLTISLGWLFYRPLVAALVGALALLPVVLTRAHAAEKKQR